jgi:hypothetical protein
MSTNENAENTQNQESPVTRGAVEYETIEASLVSMSRDPNLLKAGYNSFAAFEKNRNFYLNFLKVIFSSECCEQVRKLAASTLKIFLNKNWNDDGYITNEERLVSLYKIIPYLLKF